VTKEIDLSEVISGNLRVAESSSETVTVTVTILPEDTKELSLDVDAIAIQNLSSSLTVTYDTTELKIRVRGTQSALNKISSEDVTASVNLSGYTEGDYTVPVSVTLPDNIELSEDATILLHVKQSAKTG
jgi:YbbR domain-containing protein